MIEIELGNGKQIDHCLEKVFRFCEEDSSYEAYDCFEVAQDNSLGDLDILVANNIRAGMDGRAFLTFNRNRAKVEAALKSLPVGLALHDPWPNQQSTWQAIQDAYLACRGPQVGPTRITKVLHKKRPRLIPLIDRMVVIGRYYKSYPGRPRGEVRGMIGVTRTIRRDMMRNANALLKLQMEVKERGINLTQVRLFDMLLWEGYPAPG